MLWHDHWIWSVNQLNKSAFMFQHSLRRQKSHRMRRSLTICWWPWRQIVDCAEPYTPILYVPSAPTWLNTARRPISNSSQLVTKPGACFASEDGFQIKKHMKRRNMRYFIWLFHSGSLCHSTVWSAYIGSVWDWPFPSVSRDIRCRRYNFPLFSTIVNEKCIRYSRYPLYSCPL